MSAEQIRASLVVVEHIATSVQHERLVNLLDFERSMGGMAMNQVDTCLPNEPLRKISHENRNLFGPVATPMNRNDNQIVRLAVVLDQPTDGTGGGGLKIR